MGKFSTKGEANPDPIPTYQMAGELGLPMELAPVTGDFAGTGMLSLLKSGFRGLGGGLKRTLHDKKRLGIVIALVLIWLVVNLLAALGIFPLPVRVLSWLTAARGSLFGGSIGKGLVAALFAQIITDQEMLPSLKGGIGQLTAAVKGGKKTAAPLLLGAGAGLIVCNLLVSSNLQNTMVCVASFALAAKALTRNGFLRQLTRALMLKEAKDTAVTAVMGGWALGFALFAAVSLLSGGSNGYILGVLLVIASGGLMIAGRNKKEVAAQ